MPSKGILCYSYISAPGVSIEFTVPQDSKTRREQQTFSIDHLEIESSKLGPFKLTGRFEFVVKLDGKEIARQWVDINSLTGGLGNGTMKTMDETKAVRAGGVMVVYGFYDAGPGVGGLPRQHQCYVTVSRDCGDWMRDVVSPGSEAAGREFARMVLPSAHDIGMNSMATAMSILANAGTAAIREVLGRSLPRALEVLNRVGDRGVNAIAPDIIRALAITQKDSLPTVLALGARYFEFRPAKCHRQIQAASPLEDTWYFQHGAIPGMAYRVFLHDIVEFLAAHTDEIVVVHNRWDGVPDLCPRPSDEELKGVLAEVLQGTDIKAGSLDDMKRSVQDLRSSQTRLIVLRDARQVSNYDDVANATLTGDSMVAALQAMSENPPRDYSVMLLQCQATATNIRDVVVASVLDCDVSTSPILATKGVCDAKMLPLLRGECGRGLMRGEGLVVVGNDFFDGATADVAIGMCAERMR